jgi:hypothetical protein
MTAAKAGIAASAVQALLEDIATDAPPAIEHVMKGLPPGFLSEIADSIIGGFRARLREIA